MRVDLVRELIDRLLEISQREGTLTESLAIEVENQFRHEFHGAECVISSRPRYRTEQKRDTVVRQYLQSEKPPEVIARENGISRATLYRYLKK